MKERKIHFIGIGGIGMCGLAEYFLKGGYEVSGSDLTSTSVTERLRNLVASIFIGHSELNINEDFEIVVYTSAVKEDNPEIKRARELGLKLVKRAEMLGRIVNDRFLIAVAGTHGKTTTTAMIGKLLIDAGLDPLIFVGGNVPLFDGGTYRFGNGNFAVVEADEYDRSFLTLKPDIAVITNIDEDHLDIYKDIDDIKKTFKLFCEYSKRDGKIVYFGDDTNISDFIGNLNNDKISYGFGEGNYLKIKGFSIESEHVSYSIVNSKAEYNNINLNLFGRHNVLNSAASFAISKILKIDFEIFRKSISGFKTVDRRMQLKYDKNGIKIFDDYAHHPKEIASSIKGLKEAYRGHKLITVFQPHLYSRTKDFYRDFANELYNSDEVLLLEIYPAREMPLEGISSKLIYNELKKLFANVTYIPEKKQVIKYLQDNITQGDIIVFQGAGDVTELCSEFLKELNLKNT